MGTTPTTTLWKTQHYAKQDKKKIKVEVILLL
jgi:hypothetical protein